MKISSGLWAGPVAVVTEPITTSRVSAEILALYQRARQAEPEADFKPWAMARAAALVPLGSTNWVNGVMTPEGPRFHDVRTENMRPGYWQRFSETLKEADPLGERMFANPGVSFIIKPDELPQGSAAVLEEWDVASAIVGMVADRSTGTYSVVVWHRAAGMAPFGEAERRLHEQLLPHWVEGLHLHRVGVALRDLEVTAIPGHLAALVEATGIIHYAQAGFGELLAEDFEDWGGASLPASMVIALSEASARWDGGRLLANRRELPSGLWLVHLRRRHGTSQAQARELALSALSTTLSEREEALALATETLQEQRRQQSVLQERERIMRELHDGLGAHLVGLLQLAASGSASPQVLAAAVVEAQDELRLAVDAAHVVEGDLAALLGSLRYRLQPRLDAAGITLVWDMPDLPPLPALTTSAALHVQRILLEAVVNVIRHAGATRLWFSVTLDDAPAGQAPTLRVSVADDGVGLPGGNGVAVAPVGRGLLNMRHRAAALGASLEIGARTHGRGTLVLLRWPQRGEPARP